MDQKELYIQYLEDALNHAKTGEPMKKWQTRYIVPDGDTMPKPGWLDISIYNPFNIKYYELRIKPEPFKWTSLVFNMRGYKHGTGEGHLTKQQISESVGCDIDDIVAVYHHEIE